MSIVRIDGGLGCQMFQYAFYLYLKSIYPNSKIDLSVYNGEHFHNGFELSKLFGIDPEVAMKKEVNLLAFYETNKLSKKLKKLFRKKPTHYYEKVIGYDSELIIANEMYYEGFWQCEHYFKPVVTRIFDSYSFPAITGDNNKKIYEQIKSTNSVAIHIRRGDYLNPKNSHSVNLSETSYYLNAINSIQSLPDNQMPLEFFIFSDDIDWVKSNFHLKKSHYIDWNVGVKSYIDMQLMSYCRNIIIANSTFSWWGAYLNPSNIKKNVVAPHRWFAVDFIGSRPIKAGDTNVDGWITI